MAIAQSSVVVAILYPLGCIATFVVFVYTFCTKCPIRDGCIHVVHGMLAGIMPERSQGPYSVFDMIGPGLYFGFLAVFPQYWLLDSIYYLIAFWAILLTGLAVNSATLCRGCGNVNCPMRR